MQYLGVGGVAGLAGCGGGDSTDTPVGGNGNGDGTDTEGGNGNGTGTGTATETETATPVPETIEFDEGGTLRGSLGANVSSFDPPYSSGVPSSTAQNFFYESLTTTDAQGNIYPWLAESFELVDDQLDIGPADYTDYMVEIPYTSDADGNVFPDTDKQIAVRSPDNPDSPSEGDTGQFLTVDETGNAVADGTYGMQYQFSLHEGIQFSNGEELTAQNIVDSYVRYENSQVSAQVWINFLHAEVVDEYTVNLYAQEPSAEALSTIVVNAFPSRDTETDSDGNLEVPGGDLDPRSGNDPVGTGPFVLDTFTDEELLRVTTRDDYWLNDIGVQTKAENGGYEVPENFPNTPAVDAVEITIIPDDAQRASAILEGEIDVATGLNASQQTAFSDADNYNVVPTETGGYLFFQYSVQVPPFDQKEVRQAANYLIPRQRIVDNIEQGWSRPAWTPVPELATGAGTTDPEALEEDLKPLNEFKPDEAASLLSNADVEFPITTTIETNQENDNRVQKAQTIAQAMNNVTVDGQQAFDVSVETFEFGSLVARIFQPDYPEMNNILLIGLSGTFDPGSFCEATHHTRNQGQCCNSQGISFDGDDGQPNLDQMMDDAKFSQEAYQDPQARAEIYDDIWRTVVDLSANSYVDIDQTVSVTLDERVAGWETYPFPEGLYSFATYSAPDSQLAYVPSDGQE
jgi:ABC-type transport system substrate-binding protein